MRRLAFYALGAAVMIGCASSNSPSMRGAEIRVRYAQVQGMERVKMPSDAPAGAMVGGFTGLVIAGNRSPGRQLATGVAGATLGALATKALEGDRLGYSYTLSFADGTTSKFITEKGYLEVGDCVTVERGQYANIRRVPTTMCESGSSLVADSKHVVDAEQCHQAKEQLLVATTEQEVDTAARKVSILCHF